MLFISFLLLILGLICSCFCSSLRSSLSSFCFGDASTDFYKLPSFYFEVPSHYCSGVYLTSFYTFECFDIGCISIYIWHFPLTELNHLSLFMTPIVSLYCLWFEIYLIWHSCMTTFTSFWVWNILFHPFNFSLCVMYIPWKEVSIQLALVWKSIWSIHTFSLEHWIHLI